ncbi:MAG: phosphoribosylaminoimidazolecarboxamide formyltransferase [Erysipelotrichaceae bacterium]|nr:phosphoribosylaminoimidazolecarboxamide formyltransferase [Erysipelotrichaceae bacterium]
MKEFELRYGCNPNQKPAKIYRKDGKDLPVIIHSGKPGYINFLDAFNSWQLVKELKKATGLPAAASFKHVSPAGVSLARPLSTEERKVCFAGKGELSPIASAYILARGTDRVSSYGDFAALSDVCDASVASFLRKEVSDGIIAPGYTEEALEILRAKKGGRYVVLEIDEAYEAPQEEEREVYGITFAQKRNTCSVDESTFANIVTARKDLDEKTKRDMTVALITLKYTQSNSVCYVKDGQAIGIGAGQQSRIHCTRLAGDKADRWLLRFHEKVLSLSFLPSITRAERDNAIDVYLSQNSGELLQDGSWEKVFAEKPPVFTEEEKRDFLVKQSGLVLGSDAFFPFGDNIERAARSGVSAVIEPGGSIRDDDVIETMNKYGMLGVFTGQRLFHH